MLSASVHSPCPAHASSSGSCCRNASAAVFCVSVRHDPQGPWPSAGRRVGEECPRSVGPAPPAVRQGGGLPDGPPEHDPCSRRLGVHRTRLRQAVKPSGRTGGSAGKGASDTLAKRSRRPPRPQDHRMEMRLFLPAPAALASPLQSLSQDVTTDTGVCSKFWVNCCL